MNTWTYGGHFPQHRFGTGVASSSRATAAAHSPFRFALVSTTTSSSSLPAVPQTAIASRRVPPHRHESLPPPRLLPSYHFASHRRPFSRRLFASLRVASVRTSPLIGSHPDGRQHLSDIRHPLCNPALLKKISLPSSSFPCFVPRFLLCFPRLEIPPHPSLIRTVLSLNICSVRL